MTRFWLTLLRIICIIQVLITTFLCLSSFIGLLMSGVLILLLSVIAFGFIAVLPIFTFTVFNRNYPDKLIEGRQKKYFNRIFLINFFLIAFLFGLVFSNYRAANLQSKASDAGSGFDLISFTPFIISCCILIFHFSILYGLYWMRRQINNNVSSQQFDFEDENV
jgi:cytochrome bd-type quinol oxidase subunit 2